MAPAQPPPVQPFVPGQRAKERLKQLQRLHAFPVVVIPALGTLFAIALVPHFGVSRAQLVIVGVGYVLSMSGITVGYHRLFTHRSFKAPDAVRWVLAALGSTAAEGPVIAWSATHRAHHQYSDREMDPHSPHQGDRDWRDKLQGFWHGHIGWMFASDLVDPFRYAPDLLKDKLVQQVNRHYLKFVAAGLALPALAGALVDGSFAGALNGFLWGGLVRLFLVQHFTWSINSVCHLLGSRPYDTHDSSVNNAWLALPSLGESWHNNHHAFPASALHGQHWYQVDISALIIRTLRALGLATEVKSFEREALQHQTSKETA